MRYLALDVGDRWIGLATGDGTLRLAFPFQTLHRTNLLEDVAAIVRAYKDEEAMGLVVGLPYNSDGTLGEQARRTALVGDALAEAGLPVTYHTEHLSSAEARDRVVQSRGRPPSRGERIDHIAAALILEDFFESDGRFTRSVEAG